MEYPFPAGAPGHEGWGVVDAVGRGVTGILPGERVSLLSYHAFADYDIAKASDLLRLPDSPKNEPFPGEALGCAMNVFRRSHVQPGDIVAIVGIGFMGSLLTALCSAVARQVVALSRRAFALELARRFGACNTIELSDHAQAIEQVRALTGGAGCDCVIEATGQAAPLELAAELVRTRGRLIIAGYHQETRQVNMQLWNWRGIDVINAHERDNAVYLEGMELAAAAVACGQINPDPLYTHAFPLEQIGTAFQFLEERPKNFLKALIKL